MTASVGTSAPAPVEAYKTLAALRAGHTELLKQYHALDDASELPAALSAEIEAFRQRGRATGALLDLDEDRADAQVLLNYWTTVLYDAGLARKPAVLDEFDSAAAAASVGEGSPYRGLRAFAEADAALFYGRRRVVKRLVDVLEKGRFLAVVGLSGSGKSSVVRAGLLPDLQQGAVPGSDSWHYLPTFVPGSDPLTNLALATCPPGGEEKEWRRRLGSSADSLLETLGDRVAVLVVDQLEELFTIGSAEDDKKRFVEHLVRVATKRGTSHRVVVTLRSDFEPQLARYPALQELFVDTATVRVPPLDTSGLRTAIEMPAARQGLTFEPGLIEELVHQVVGEPAGLPLLQFTLQKLWERRQGRVITWNAYRGLGGNVREILARSADATYQSFALEEDRSLVEAIFARLVEPAPAGEVTSHRLPRASLYTIDAAQARIDRVVDKLLADGLLRVTPGATSAEDQLEVTHEALIRNWPRLVDWIADTRHRRRNRLQLAAAAESWAAHGRGRSGLLTGALLAEAQEVRDATPLEAELIAASSRAGRRNWQILAAFLAVLVFLLALSLFQSGRASKAVLQKEKIDRDTQTSRAQYNAVKQKYEEVTQNLHEAEVLKANTQRQLQDVSAAVSTLQAERNKAQSDYQQTLEQLETQSALVKKAEADNARVKLNTEQALARLEAMRTEFAETEAQLAAVKRQLSEAQEAAATADRLRAQAEDAKTRAVATAEQSQRQLQASEQQLQASEREHTELKQAAGELIAARPAIVVKDDKLDDVPKEWRLLKDRRSEILEAASSVGAMESEGGFLATGFVVANDAIITFSDSRQRPQFIDFDNRPGPKSEHRFPVLELIAANRQAGPYGAAFSLWRVSRLSTVGKPLPRPLRLARKPSLAPGLPRLVIGYPMATGAANKGSLLRATLDLVLGDDSGVKRVMPGYLLSVNEEQRLFIHDSFTVAGTAGSPVLDLESGKVIGFHFAGGPVTAESPGAKLAIALWLYANDPAFQKAGVRFEP